MPNEYRIARRILSSRHSKRLKGWESRSSYVQTNRCDAGHARSLGVPEMGYSPGIFSLNGNKKQLGSPDLEAEKDGTRFTVVPQGILTQTSVDGHLSLLVTRIDDRNV